MKYKAYLFGLGLLIADIGFANAAMRQYSAGTDSSNWDVNKTNRLSCSLHHEIPYYGYLNKSQFTKYRKKHLNV